MNEITNPTNAAPLQTRGITPRPVNAANSDSFGQVLKQSLNEVNQLQNEADQAIDALATGQQKDIHNTMIAMEKADIAFRLLMEIRNKVISAYETIMRMQV
jgi:flagellar hook-basal body complex protein FliE